MSFILEHISRAHDRTTFDCGTPSLNEYLQRYALQNHERYASRTYVACRDEEFEIVGFFTLVVASIEFSSVPDGVLARTGKHPVPVVHLARLGVSRSVQGQRLGEALLSHACLQVIAIAELAGALAMDVYAKDEQAKSFYLHYKFVPLLDDPHHLMLPLRSVQQWVNL